MSTPGGSQRRCKPASKGSPSSCLVHSPFLQISKAVEDYGMKSRQSAELSPH